MKNAQISVNKGKLDIFQKTQWYTKWISVFSEPNFSDLKNQDCLCVTMHPFLFSCNQCPETFISSKILRSHVCEDISNFKSSDAEQEHEEKRTDSVWVFPSSRTIESEKYFERYETKESNHFKETTKVEKVVINSTETALATDLMNQTDLTKLADHENETLDRKDEKLKFSAFTCPLCKKYLPSSASLGIHTRIHELDQAIHCQVQDCGETFNLKKRLWEHMKSAHGEEKDSWAGARLKCDHCEKIFDNKTGLKVHAQKHSQEKNYLCALCPKRFKSRDSLRFHKRRHDGEENFECKHCERKYVAHTLLRAHVLAKHETSTEVFTCDHCKKEFNKKEKLKYHITLHTGERPFKCREGCEKYFRNRNCQYEHERMHRGVKEFQCASCPKMFMKKTSLRVHMKRHEGKKDHQCAVCGKAFVEPAGARNCRHSGK